MPVWQNWWGWQYLATRVLVVAGASVAELMELTVFGHMHSCSFVCVSFSKQLLKKSWSDLYSSWNTDLPSSRRFWRKASFKKNNCCIYQILHLTVSDRASSLLVFVLVLCYMHWCCMPVPSPNRGDFVWEADWPRLATKLSLFSLIQPQLSQTGDCKICMSQNLLIFQKLSWTKMWLYFCCWHMLCDETECFYIMRPQASEKQSDVVKHFIGLHGHHTRSLASLDRSFRCHCAHSFIHCAVHVLIHTLLTRVIKQLWKYISCISVPFLIIDTFESQRIGLSISKLIN